MAQNLSRVSPETGEWKERKKMCESGKGQVPRQKRGAHGSQRKGKEKKMWHAATPPKPEEGTTYSIHPRVSYPQVHTVSDLPHLTQAPLFFPAPLTVAANTYKAAFDYSTT